MRCKGVYCVDLGESFQMSTSIYLVVAKIGFAKADNGPSKVPQ